MTIRSILELSAQADANLPDNVTQLISAADVRNLIKDFLDTMSPAYGAMSCTSVIETVGAVPVVIAPWTAINSLTAGYFTANLTNGSVTRLIGTAALAGATDFIIASGDAAGAVNSIATIELYKNGVATGLKMSVNLTGASEPIGFNIAALQYTASPGDAVYDLRASGSVGSATFSNLVMIVQSQPVRSFV